MATATTMESTVAPGRSQIPSEAAAEPSRGGVVMTGTGDGLLTGRKIVVDPGHNGRNPSNIVNAQVPAGRGRTKPCNSSGTANSDMSEHTFNWELANELTTRLRSHGATVVLTRPSDDGVGPCVNERAAIGNRGGADLVVSLHADGATGGSARGFHVIRSTAMAGGQETVSRSEVLAEKLVGALESTGMPRATYVGGASAIAPREDIAGMNLSEPPAAMIELGNMRHPADAAMQRDAAFRQKAAIAITSAVENYLAR